MRRHSLNLAFAICSRCRPAVCLLTGWKSKLLRFGGIKNELDVTGGCRCRRCSTWFSPNRLDYFEIACASRSIGTPSLHFNCLQSAPCIWTWNISFFLFLVAWSWGHPQHPLSTASSSSAGSISGILLRSIFHVQHWGDRRERCHRRWHNKHAIYFMPGIQVPPQSVKAKEEPNPILVACSGLTWTDLPWIGLWYVIMGWWYDDACPAYTTTARG